MFCGHVMGSNLDSDESLVTSAGSAFPEILLHNLNHRKTNDLQMHKNYMMGKHFGTLIKVVSLKSQTDITVPPITY